MQIMPVYYFGCAYEFEEQRKLSYLSYSFCLTIKLDIYKRTNNEFDKNCPEHFILASVSNLDVLFQTQ
jgi:hypothetical protein